MTVKLTNNFLANARGLTLKDSASCTWSINSNTNEISATTGGGTVGSVGLADGSTTPLYTISGSPVTGSGTLTFALKTQSANLVLAGPGSGSAAQPTFRALVVGDIPTGYAYSSLSGAPTIPSGANPSASAGLTPVNGSAATFMRSDAAPALSQSIAPTWSGQHIFSYASGAALAIIGGTPFIAAYTTTALSTRIGYLQFNSSGVSLLNLDVNQDLQLRTNSTNRLVVGAGGIGVNGNATYAQSTGWGTPTGGSVQASFAGGSATLATCTAAVAQLITILKGIGFLGA